MKKFNIFTHLLILVITVIGMLNYCPTAEPCIDSVEKTINFEETPKYKIKLSLAENDYLALKVVADENKTIAKKKPRKEFLVSVAEYLLYK